MLSIPLSFSNIKLLESDLFLSSDLKMGCICIQLGPLKMALNNETSLVIT